MLNKLVSNEDVKVEANQSRPGEGAWEAHSSGEAEKEFDRADGHTGCCHSQFKWILGSRESERH